MDRAQRGTSRRTTIRTAVAAATFACAVGAVTPTAARAAEVTVSSDRTANIVTVKGMTVAGDAKRFAAALARLEPNRPTVVMLSGPGGVMVEGLEIGMAIHAIKAATRVDAGDACISACALEWLAGSRLLMSRDSQIGLHAPFDSRTHESPAILGAVMRQYAAALGLPDEVARYIWTANPTTGMAWMTPEEGARLGIAVEEVPGLKPTARADYHGNGYRAFTDVAEEATQIDRRSGPAGLERAMLGCGIAYDRSRRDDDGMRCFILEIIGQQVEDLVSKEEKRAADGRFTKEASRRRVLYMLAAAGMDGKTAMTTIRTWSIALRSITR